MWKYIFVCDAHRMSQTLPQWWRFNIIETYIHIHNRIHHIETYIHIHNHIHHIETYIHIHNHIHHVETYIHNHMRCSSPHAMQYAGSTWLVLYLQISDDASTSYRSIHRDTNHTPHSKTYIHNHMRCNLQVQRGVFGIFKLVMTLQHHIEAYIQMQTTCHAICRFNVECSVSSK